MIYLFENKFGRVKMKKKKLKKSCTKYLYI